MTKEQIEAFEKGKLFARCLAKVEDDEGVYCREGEEYEIAEIDTDINTITLDLDVLSIVISIEDPAFELFIKE